MNYQLAASWLTQLVDSFQLQIKYIMVA